MKNKFFIITILSAIALLWAGYAIGVGTSNTFDIRGIFPWPNGWDGDTSRRDQRDMTRWWHPGRVIFASGTTHDAYFTSTGMIHGAIWLGNAGWATFDHGVAGLAPKINCPSDVLENATQLCYLSWAVWSKNAGWIVLDRYDIADGGKGVYYNPNTANFEGWWWSKWLGWVPFWSNLVHKCPPANPDCKEELLTGEDDYDPLRPQEQWDWTIPASNIRFIGKIAIIGNIAGTRVFSVQNVWNHYDQDMRNAISSVNQSSIFNTIRKNIALMTRNVPKAMYIYKSPDLRTYPQSNLDFMEVSWDYNIDNNWNIRDNLWYKALNTAFKKTVIVRWGDVNLDKEWINMSGSEWGNPAFALIVLKDDAWNWGNIFITDKVRWIHAFIYAEWSVFSWKKESSGEKYYITHNPSSVPWTFSLPQKQLYIRGSVISKNTIGGTQQQGGRICPVFVQDCTLTKSKQYDWNYFRLYDHNKPEQSSIPQQKKSVFPENVKKATIIIEYDPTILTDPPPGFRTQSN